ncbi:restriction endonuclease subunit S [Companilactobacillus jidongensis]|uniref:restriction endonuclease subunit S n=1 Tax=Companilactobacillus jidongensis TaxID=2486006 RepID=UPI000F76D9D3|nr:restriction endonuclease subunit S [Companilactobacillus jidongensis]
MLTEQRKLEEIGNFIRESIDPQKMPDERFYEYSMPAYDRSRNPDMVFGETMHSNRIKISNYVLLINKLNVRQKRIWLVNAKFDNSVASSEFIPFKSKSIDLKFLEQFLLSNRTTKKLESISSGTSNSQKRISPNDLLNFIVQIPYSRGEQTIIGSLLKHIDDSIKFEEKRLSQLQQMKKYYLQKLFI